MKLYQHLSDQTPKGTVISAHGYAEHSGRYTHFFEALNNAAYDVWAIDFTGHGHADGKRAQVNVGALITAHMEARRDIQFETRTEKMHLFGHSMGGLVALASGLLMPHHLTSMVVTGPGLRPRPRLGMASVKAGVFIAKFLPGFGTVKLDSTLLTHDPEMVAERDADELVYVGKAPLLTGATMMLQGDYVIQNAPLLTKPALILHGGDDQVVDISGAEEFVSRAGDLAQLKVLPGQYHELLHEVEREQTIRDIIDWLDGQ